MVLEATFNLNGEALFDQKGNTCQQGVFPIRDELLQFATTCFECYELVDRRAAYAFYCMLFACCGALTCYPSGFM